MVANIVFLFPGQGSQAIGMGKYAHDNSPHARRLFEIADEKLGYSLSKLMFEGPEDRLRETVVTQPALFLASAAALELLKEHGIKASFAAGHSLGEYSALYAAGVLSFPDALFLVQERGKLMQEAGTQSSGTMAAVIGLDAAKLEAVCKEASSSDGVCVPANFNSESQIVISGSVKAVEKAMQLAQTAGAAKVVQLNVSGAFHSPLMTTAAQKMKTILDKTTFSNANFPVITNVDAQPTKESADFQQKLFQQIDHAVRWHETLKKAIELSAEAFVEVGSGRVLSTMAKKLDRKKIAVATDDFEAVLKAFTSVAAS